ncbi:hypothetical protein T440DRAFT_267321 [Plenodomus tracheiphilus IPT5]|uniref:C2H2-type domain-containing protein n=1 Tax=Plenodomus tracheiphilus IPT5 TaxID=1408161 RepID=A0A6A7BI39_9PLEO|nr:hypothetical protein T440DRAFT_267321 [Plenodomus tracheiphilus IPT5]
MDPLAAGSNVEIPPGDGEEMIPKCVILSEAGNFGSVSISERGTVDGRSESNPLASSKLVEFQAPPDLSMWPGYTTYTSVAFNPSGFAPVPQQMDDIPIEINQPLPAPSSSFEPTFLVSNPSLPYVWDPDHQNTTKHVIESAPFFKESQRSVNLSAVEDTTIGSVSLNGRLQCDKASCVGRSFGRIAELRRHFEGAHAAQKPQFWCHESSCARSAVAGDHPFYRKDKRDDHVRKMHFHLLNLRHNGERVNIWQM